MIDSQVLSLADAECKLLPLADFLILPCGEVLQAFRNPGLRCTEGLVAPILEEGGPPPRSPCVALAGLGARSQITTKFVAAAVSRAGLYTVWGWIALLSGNLT
jgi:hypothetical protein